MNKTSNENVNYIIECAEFVGITIDENTPIDFAIIARIIRKYREPTMRAFEKAYEDGKKDGYNEALHQFEKERR